MNKRHKPSRGGFCNVSKRTYEPTLSEDELLLIIVEAEDKAAGDNATTKVCTVADVVRTDAPHTST